MEIVWLSNILQLKPTVCFTEGEVENAHIYYLLLWIKVGYDVYYSVYSAL